MPSPDGDSEATLQELRVMLVDDSQPFLAAAQGLLSAEPWINIVGAFPSAEAALAQVEALQPDVILLDLLMPVMNGFEATPLFKAKPSAPRVVLVTMMHDAGFRAAATARGADGFVPKSLLPTQLVPLLRSMCQ